MRITILTLGTRGDVWPHVALAAQLVDRDHHVTVATTTSFQKLVDATGARFAPLPTDLTAFMASDAGQVLMRAGGSEVAKAAGAYFAGFRHELDDATLAASEGAEALVANHITFQRAVVIADWMRVPVALAFPLPVGPTRSHQSPFFDFPIPTATGRYLSHQLVVAAWGRAVRPEIRAFRRRLALPADAEPAMRRITAAPALQLHPYSPTILPAPTDWGPDQLVTGYWRLPDHVRTAAGETVPDDVSAFIEAGPPPLYLGVGSMPVQDPRGLIADIAAVTADLGVRALVDAKCCADVEQLPQHLHPVGVVDHDRLLPRCRAAMHHGGNGTNAASLRAGLPTLICSIFGDQHFWGGRVQHVGAGAHIRFRKLDRDTLSVGIQRILDPSVTSRAAEVGRAIRAEGDGTAIAAQALEDWLVTAQALPLHDTRRPRRLRAALQRRTRPAGVAEPPRRFSGGLSEASASRLATCLERMSHRT